MGQAAGRSEDRVSRVLCPDVGLTVAGKVLS